jgi:hypothetical protein
VGSYTSPKTTVETILTSSWKTVLSGVPVVGSAGEPIEVKFYANISGLIDSEIASPYGVVIDTRYLRNSITDETDPGFDETGLDTYNPSARYKDIATGEPFFKQFISDTWFFARNCSTIAVQVRVYNAETCTIKAGAFAGSTDHD